MIPTVLWGLALSVAGAQDEPDVLVNVVVAVRDLPEGTVVHERDLDLVEIPERALPEGGVTRAEEVVGHELEGPVFTGELVHARWVGPRVDARSSVVPDGWVMLALGAPVVEVGTRHDVVPERTECALLQDVVSAWDAPAAMAVRPEQVDEALLLGTDTPLRLMPVDPERPPCAL